MSIEDRNRDDFILEEDFKQTFDLIQTQSKTGDRQTQATRAMFSFKSELDSLIGNL